MDLQCPGLYLARPTPGVSPAVDLEMARTNMSKVELVMQLQSPASTDWFPITLLSEAYYGEFNGVGEHVFAVVATQASHSRPFALSAAMFLVFRGEAMFLVVVPTHQEDSPGWRPALPTSIIREMRTLMRPLSASH